MGVDYGWFGGQTDPYFIIITQRGGGSQELIIILQGTKVGGVKLITPLPSIQNKQIISNFPSLPLPI